MIGRTHKITCSILALALMVSPFQAINAKMKRNCETMEVVLTETQVNQHETIVYEHESVEAGQYKVNCIHCDDKGSCCDNNSCKCHIVTSFFVVPLMLSKLAIHFSSSYFSSYLANHVQHDSAPLLRPPIV